tara:strand:+ start:76 stop:1647 length:1572 start_codon:yes stop_codon:yes gene_type:complete
MAKEIIEAEIKSNIGEVTKDVDKATKSTKKLAEETEDVGKAAVKSSGGVKKLAVGFGTLVKASGIVFLLQKAFEAFQEVLGKNQKVIDFFSTTMTTLSIVFNDLFKYLDKNYTVIKGYLKGLFTDPLGELAKLGMGIEKFFIEKMKGATLVLEGAWTIMKNITNPKKMLEGMAKIAAGTAIAGKEMAAIYNDIESAVSEYTSSVIESAKGITETEKAAAKAAVEFARLNAQYLKDAEIQRQIRDDVSKTFAERIKANEDLNTVLTKQQTLQREQLDIQEKAAQLQFNNNDSLANFITLQEAKNAKLELEEAITGQLSEQKTNQKGLELELLDAQKQVRAEGLSGIQKELQELQDAYDLKLEMARKSGMDTTAIDKQFQKQKSQIVQEGVNAQLEAFSGLAGSLGALAGESKELAIGQAIIDTYVGANKAYAQGGTVGFVTAAAVIAAGLANVQKIMSTPVGDAGGGGGSVSATSPAPPAPQMMSGAFELTGGQKVEPTRAYVVSDDITASQDALAIIRRRATI